MWKLSIGIAVGTAIGLGGTLSYLSCAELGNTEENTESSPAHQAIPVPTDHTDVDDHANEEPTEPDEFGYIRVFYKSHGVIAVERMRNRNRLLVVLQEGAFEIGPMLGIGVHTGTQKLEDGGELFTAVFKSGTGTGFSSHDALVILSRPGQPPAIAQLWHGGYGMDRQQCCHYANTIRYEVQGNSLTTHFEYGYEKSVLPYTDTIELIPGQLVTHRCEEVWDLANALISEDDGNTQLPFDTDALVRRELNVNTDPRTKWASIVLLEDDKRFMLTEFRAQQNIFDIATSPDGRFGYVWHNEYSPRNLSIYDLDQRKKLVTFVPGVGGIFRWTPANTLCLNYGFGTDSFGYYIYNTQGESIASGSSSGGEFNANASLMVTFPTLFAATDPVRIIDTATGEVIREIATDELGRGIEVVRDIFWTRDGLRLEYHYDPEATYSQTPETMTILFR